MPIIINEIEISVTVSDSNSANSTGTADGSLKQEIVKECIEQIMEILDKKNER
jgi:hypothetical protein